MNNANPSKQGTHKTGTVHGQTAGLPDFTGSVTSTPTKESKLSNYP
jgi:hypothetical protein